MLRKMISILLMTAIIMSCFGTFAAETDVDVSYVDEYVEKAKSPVMDRAAEVEELEAPKVELLNASPASKDESAGEGVIWDVTNGMLMVKGMGNSAIDDFKNGKAPWYKYKNGITFIYLSGIETIGEGAFFGLDNVTSIYLTNEIKEIKANAFAHCSSLTSFVMPESLTYIGEYAFKGCKKLKEIIVPKSVTNIGEGAFEDCDGFSVFAVEGNGQYVMEDGVLYNADKTKLILYPSYLDSESFALPKTVKEIADYAFKNAEYLKSVTLNDKLEKIGHGAFYNCSMLETLKITKSVSFIGANAFHGCSSLDSFTADSKNKIFKAVSGVLRDADGKLIRYPSNRVNDEYTIPSTIHSIGEDAFEGVRHLEVIEFHKGVDNIDSFAFDNAQSIRKVIYQGSSQQWALIYIGSFNDVITEAPKEFGEEVNSYTIMIGETYNLMDYLNDEQKKELEGAEEINVNASVPNIVAIDVENRTLTAASVGETLVTATAKVGAAKKKVSVLINVTYNADAAGLNLEFIEGDDSFDLKDLAEVSGFNSFWESFSWVSTNPSVATVVNGIVTPVSEGETTILARLQDDKKAISCKVVVKKENIDYSLYYAFDVNTNTITRYYGGMDNDVIVPDKINDVPVLRIGKNAFKNSHAKRVTISKGVEYIDENAFDSSTELSYISLPYGLKEIGDFAFYGCSSLHNITIPGTVDAEIGTGWFENCRNFKGAVLENGIEFLGDGFKGSNVQSVTLPNSLRRIEEFAFDSCTNLKNINFPSNLTYIARYAFYNCVSLKKIDLNRVSYINEYAFYNTGLNNVDLGDKIEYIGVGSFGHNISLKKIVIPGSIKEIPNDAFSGCQYLSDVTISEGVEYILYSAFSYCNIKSITIPNSVKQIYSDAFSYNYNLSDVNLGTGVKTIGANAFAYCYGIRSVVIPNNVTSLGSGVFRGCSYLTEITIGKGITNIAKSLFDECKSIKKVILSEGVTSIGDNAFRSCSSIEEIVIPSTVRYIGAYAFAYCNGLKTVNIPSGVDTIGSCAFYNCAGLSEVDIDARYVGTEAFSQCYKLTDASFGSNVYSIGTDAFYNSYNLRNVDFSEGLNNIGAYAFAWCEDLRSVELPDSLRSINSYGFYRCTYLKDVDFGEGVTSIGSYGFAYTPVDEVHLPDSLSTISNYAFYNCTSIKDLEFGNSLYSIGNYAFYNCNKIKKITIPDSLRIIGQYGFAYCSDLEEVENLTALVNVGYNAFYGCSFLSNMLLKSASYEALTSDVIGYIPLELNYEFPDDVDLSGAYVKITLPESVSILSGSFKINGKPSSDFVERDASYGTYLEIPVTEKIGKIVFTIEPEAWQNISSTAHMYYNLFGMSQSILVGTVNCDLPDITVSTVDVTSSNQIIVEGMTQPYSNVTLYVDDVLQKTVYANYNGNYKTYLTLNDTEDHKVYTIKAEADIAEALPAYTTVKYVANTPNLESLIMYYGKNGRIPSKYNLTSSQRLNLTWGDYMTGKGKGYSYNFEVNLSNAEEVDKVYVVSVRNNEKSYLEAKWNGEAYVTSGHFKDDYEYIIGTLSVEYTKKLKPAEIMNSSDTVAYFDVGSNDLSPSINEYTEDYYSVSVLVGEALQESLGDSIDLSVETSAVDDVSYYTEKMSQMALSYELRYDNKGYILAVDERPDAFILYLLNKDDMMLTTYDVVFNKVDEEGFSDRLFIDDVENVIDGLADKYESLYGIDINEEKLYQDMAMLSLTMEQEESVNETYKKFTEDKKAFLLTSLILSSATVGDISADRSVLQMFVDVIEKDLNFFRELKLANIYKLSSDISIRWYIDPSGFVYEGVKGNRLEGVTATIYYKGENDNPEFWVDEGGQQNPVVTDASGKFKWDVTPGEWCVKFEKDGYKPYTTDWMTVPPAKTDVNVELEPLNPQLTAPEVKITTEEIVITYNDYMTPASVIENLNIEGMTADDYTVVYNEGSENIDADFENKDMAGNEYAKVFTVKFKEKLLEGDSLKVSIGNVLSHIADVYAPAFEEGTLQTQEPEIKEVTLVYNAYEDGALYLGYRNNTGIAIDFCKVMVAVYGENDCLISMTPIEIDNFAAYANTETLKVDLDEGYSYVKLFVWDADNRPFGCVETINP